MKKNILIHLLSVFITSVCVAQNYQMVKSDRNAYFKSANMYNTQINTWHLDSLAVAGNDSVFYNYKVIEHDLNTIAYCADGYDTSWTGCKTIITPSGDNIFFNQIGDSIIIKTSANINDTWTIYNFANGDRIEATITSLNQQTVFGYSDSIKTISLQAKDILNNPIANVLNAFEIKIGKETGLIKAYNFNLFPDDTLSYTLCGISNPDYGVRNITPQEIYDFSVGDTFHYFEQRQTTLPEHTNNYIEQVILSKNLFADSVQYNISQAYYREQYVYPNLTTTFSTDTFLRVYYFNAPGLFTLPFELYPIIAGGVGTLGITTFISDTTHNNRQKKHINENLYFDVNFNNCVTPTISDCAAPEYTYAEGLGLIGWNDPTCIFLNEMNLVYYSKGTEAWGNRLSWATILGVKNIDKALNVSIFPNPFTDVLQLNFGDNSNHDFIICISDLLGRTVFETSYTNQSHIEINTSSFKKGIYNLAIKTSSKSSNYKINK